MDKILAGFEVTDSTIDGAIESAGVCSLHKVYRCIWKAVESAGVDCLHEVHRCCDDCVHGVWKELYLE